jgi:hypothetical protein
MKCEKEMYLMVLHLNGEINEQEKRLFESHLNECPACKQEFVQMKLMHHQLGAITTPEPDMPQMHREFHSMLNDYKLTSTQNRVHWFSAWKEKLQEYWQPAYSVQLAMGILLLLMGWAGGYWFRPEKDNQEQLTQLTREVQQVRETILLNMLDKPGATDRLKAVNATQNLETVDEKVIQALLQTLNTDPNVNVRLVTVETLRQFADYPQVREGLIQSITRQESALVQIALADVMVGLQEKRSVEQLQRLLEQENLDETVKTKLKETVKVLL